MQRQIRHPARRLLASLFWLCGMGASPLALAAELQAYGHQRPRRGRGGGGLHGAVGLGHELWPGRAAAGARGRQPAAARRAAPQGVAEAAAAGGAGNVQLKPSTPWAKASMVSL